MDGKFWRAAHAALMPDYNRAAATYWWCVTLLGASVIVAAFLEASLRPLPVQLEVFGVCAASMLAGAFPVPLRGTKSSFSGAEIFIFLALLYVGPDAACLAAAAEAFIASARTSKRWTSRLLSPAVAAGSIGITGWLFLRIVDALQARQLYTEGTLLGLLPAMAIAHFLLTGCLVRMVLHLKAEKPMRLAVLLESFGWIGSTYAANAFIAALLYLTARHAGAIVLLAAVPMIALLLATLHFHFRQREAEAAEARAVVAAAEREAAQTARHNQELRRMASHDATTSRVDRRRFLERLVEALGREARIRRSVAVMYVDFERFQPINATLGPAAGDELLVHVASRIRRRLRWCDLVGVLGGGEFAVLVKDLDTHRVVKIAERILDALDKPYAVDGVTVKTGASIGVTFSDHGYDTADDMMRDAAAAMRQAKSLETARYVVHRPDILPPAASPERNALLDA